MTARRIVEIVRLKEEFDFYLYVDEAHTFGIYGDFGGGICRQLNISSQVDFIMSTLSKSTASIGGFLACKAKYIPVLEWAPGYIYQACFTPPDAAAILECLSILDCADTSNVLHANNLYMRALLLENGFNLGKSQSPIIPVYIPDLEKLHRVNRWLYENGIFSVSIYYPVVGKREGRIRFIVTSSHSREQIERTVELLSQAKAHFEI